MSPDDALELPGLVRDRVAEGRAKARATRARKAEAAEIAEHLPVARVLVDVPAAHLDRTFDYAVPMSMAESAQPGVRVKVRFAGRDLDGFVLAREASSDHDGRLAPLRRVVSPEPVLAPAVAQLAADIARRYAGSRSDVLRLAIPPRHAATEAESSAPPATPPSTAPDPSLAWAGHEPGGAFLRHLGAGGSPRAVWQAAAGTDWPLLLAHACAATLASGRGTIVCVPDGKDVARVSSALSAIGVPHVALTAEAGPAQRYRDFLAVSRGVVPVVVGTRAAAFAPVHQLGLVAIWDDGDDLHAEPRAPYPHARETLLLRAEREQTGVLIGGFARTVEADHLVASGWAHEIRPTRELARRVLVGITGDTDHDLDRDPLTRVSRVPGEVHTTIRAALERGPVLVQTPRHGYAAALACDRCRQPARCSVCSGPLRLTGPTTPPGCGWCGHEEVSWACPVCGGHGLRAPVLGNARTAEELGRAFPGTRVLTSSGAKVLAEVLDRPAIVVATPGAEPVAPYQAVVLLDTWLMLDRPGLRAQEEALRRWSNAVGLAAPGARALAVGAPEEFALQALVRWDQPGFARREAGQRQQAHLPPASRVATISGEPGAVDDALTLLQAPPGAEVLGPVVEGGEARVVVRVPRASGAALSDALGELQRLRSARKLDPVKVRVDPVDL